MTAEDQEKLDQLIDRRLARRQLELYRPYPKQKAIRAAGGDSGWLEREATLFGWGACPRMDI